VSCRAVYASGEGRTQKIRVFPNEASLERLVSAVLIEIDEQWADCKQTYIDWKKPDAE
jgi:transposase-like protein